jgi:hypothetical protein
MVPIPEGQIIVRCPFCDLRSMVRGETGVQRYQLERRINREQADQSMRRFLSSHSAIAGDAPKSARWWKHLSLPFWTGWRAGWIRAKQVGSGDPKRYEPRNPRCRNDLEWSCDVGELGGMRPAPDQFRSHSIRQPACRWAGVRADWLGY